MAIIAVSPEWIGAIWLGVIFFIFVSLFAVDIISGLAGVTVVVVKHRKTF